MWTAVHWRPLKSYRRAISLLIQWDPLPNITRKKCGSTSLLLSCHSRSTHTRFWHFCFVSNVGSNWTSIVCPHPCLQSHIHTFTSSRSEGWDFIKHSAAQQFQNFLKDRGKHRSRRWAFNTPHIQLILSMEHFDLLLKRMKQCDEVAFSWTGHTQVLQPLHVFRIPCAKHCKYT